MKKIYFLFLFFSLVIFSQGNEDKEIIKQQLKIWSIEKINTHIKKVNQIEGLIKKNSQLSSLTVNDFIFDSLENINN